MEFNKETFLAMLESEEGKAAAEEAIAAGLKNKNQELLSKLSNKNEELNSYKSLGDIDQLAKTMQEMQAAKDAIAAKEKEALKASGDVEAMQKHFEEQLAAKESAYGELKSQLVNDKVTSQLKSAITKAGGNAELLMPVLQNRVRGELENGSVVIDVLDQAGQTMYVDGNRAGMNELVNELKTNESYQVAFKPSGGQGSGSSTQHKVLASSNGSVDVNSPDFDWAAVEKAVDKGTYVPKYQQVSQTIPGAE